MDLRFLSLPIRYYPLLLLVAMALLGPLVTPHTYFETHLACKNQPPSWQFWFGTDALGRDLFARVWYGARISLLVGGWSVLTDLAIGVPYGAMAALRGGWAEEAMMRLADILHSIPHLILVILLLLSFGPGLAALLLAMLLMSWIPMARIVRAQILQLKQREFFLGAIAVGARTPRLLLQHLLPNCSHQILATMTLHIPAAIFMESFLSFLGVGAQAPLASFGTLLADGLPALCYYPWRLLLPAFFLTLTLLSFHLIGESTRSAP